MNTFNPDRHGSSASEKVDRLIESIEFTSISIENKRDLHLDPHTESHADIRCSARKALVLLEMLHRLIHQDIANKLNASDPLEARGTHYDQVVRQRLYMIADDLISKRIHSLLVLDILFRIAMCCQDEEFDVWRKRSILWNAERLADELENEGIPTAMIRRNAYETISPPPSSCIRKLPTEALRATARGLNEYILTGGESHRNDIAPLLDRFWDAHVHAINDIETDDPLDASSVFIDSLIDRYMDIDDEGLKELQCKVCERIEWDDDHG